MSFVLDESFEWFLEKFGDPQQAQLVTKDTMNKYSGILPGQLLQYWEEYGFCRFKDGLLFIVNPDEYQNIMITWLADTNILEEDNYYIIARSGYGDLFLWGERKGNNYVVQPRQGRIFTRSDNSARISKGLQDEVIRGFFDVIAPDDIDLEDVDTDKSIFTQAVKKFGPLVDDEMFTFEPALFLGGEQTLATVNKVNIFIQLEILAGMAERNIMDIKGLTQKAFS